MSNKLKLKVRTKLPAALVGRTGIAVVKDGLTYNLDLDYSGLVQTSQFDPINDLFAVWNKATGVWNTINPASFVAGSFYSATAASQAVPDGASLVAIQRTSPSATALTLPSLENQGGRAIVIVDWSTSVTNNAITITPASGTGTTIMKAANWTINSSASQAAAVVLYPSLDLNSWYIAPLSNFLQAGTGAVPRTFQNKARESVSVTDFGTATQAVAAVTAATGGGMIVVPNGAAPTLPASYPNIAFDYYGPHIPTAVSTEATPEAGNFAQRVFRVNHSGNHPGESHVSSHLETRVDGSLENGPGGADLCSQISMIKKGYAGGSAAAGEMDGFGVVLRQDGPDTGIESDSSAMLVNAYTASQNTFLSGLEGRVGTILRAPTFAIQKEVGYQIGVINNKNSTSFAAAFLANTGSIDTGILVQSASGAAFSDFLVMQDSSGKRYRMSGGGFHHLYSSAAPGDETQKITIGNNSGTLQILNAANTVSLFSLDQSGNGAVSGNLGATGALTGNDLTITGTAAIAYTPTVTPQTTPGSFAYTATGKYKKVGKVVDVWVSVAISTLSTAAGVMSVSLPSGVAVVSGMVSPGSAVNPNLGKAASALANFTSASAVDVFFDGAGFPATGAHTIHLHVSYMTT